VTGRRITTAVTLTVLCGLLVAMAVVGFQAATAPLPGLQTGEEECTAVEKDVKKFVARREVQVSVFNASNRSGLAGRTLDRLVERGFKPGNPGNAPDGVKVRRAVVWTTEEDDSSALLVARNLGTGVRVIVTEQDLGPGVDVLIGNRFKRLPQQAPRRVQLPDPVETCIDVS
jgi:hypothetical protein